MVMEEDKLQNFVSSIQDAPSGFHLFKILKAAGLIANTQFFQVTRNFNDRSTLQERVALSNWPPELIARCSSTEVMSDSPYFMALRRAVSPQNDFLPERATPASNSADRQATEVLIQAGMLQHLYIPVRAADGVSGAVSFAGGQDRRLEERIVAELAYLSQLVFEKLEFGAVAASQKPGLLSERELQCLGGLARGLTVKNVAAGLDLSEFTVTYHLKNSAIKLAAKTRSHAIAKAVGAGLIRP